MSILLVKLNGSNVAFQSDIKQNDTIGLLVDFDMCYSCDWQNEI